MRAGVDPRARMFPNAGKQHFPNVSQLRALMLRAVAISAADQPCCERQMTRYSERDGMTLPAEVMM